jgi:hypothetical protein
MFVLLWNQVGGSNKSPVRGKGCGSNLASFTVYLTFLPFDIYLDRNIDTVDCCLLKWSIEVS